MTTSTTKTRKKTTVERWPKKLAHFFSDSLAMNDSTLYLLHFVNPIVASCDDAPQAAYEPFSPSLYLSSRKYMIDNEGNYWLEIFNLPITEQVHEGSRSSWSASTQIEDAEQTVFSVPTDAHVLRRSFGGRGKGEARFLIRMKKKHTLRMRRISCA